MVEPVQKSMKSRENGALSPLHTRRQGQADNPPAPDFMGYPCEDVVRRLEALFDSETVDDEDSGKADDIKEESVSAVAVILESMMTHNIDYQKRIAGELRFHKSGEYASDDISNRPKPFFVYRTQPVIAPESTRDSDDDLTWEDSALDDTNDGTSEISPLLYMPQNFWNFAREYTSPIDADYIFELMEKVLKNCSAVAPEEKSRISKLQRKRDAVLNHHSHRSEANRHQKSRNGHGRKGSYCGKGVDSKRLGESRRYSGGNLVLNHSSDTNGISKGIKRKRSHGSVPHGFTPRFSRSLENLADSFIDSMGSANNHKNRTLMTSNEDSSKVDGNANDESIHGLDDTLRSSFGLSETSNNGGLRLSGSVAEDRSSGIANNRNEATDEVSAALWKARQDLQQNEVKCREAIIKLWNRVLAEYLRVEKEKALNEADQKLFTTVDKYYKELPFRLPQNDRERNECRKALQWRNLVAAQYYNHININEEYRSAKLFRSE